MKKKDSKILFLLIIKIILNKKRFDHSGNENVKFDTNVQQVQTFFCCKQKCSHTILFTR